jgi:hypothetical protein
VHGRSDVSGLYLWNKPAITVAWGTLFTVALPGWLYRGTIAFILYIHVQYVRMSTGFLDIVIVCDALVAYNGIWLLIVYYASIHVITHMVTCRIVIFQTHQILVMCAYILRVGICSRQNAYTYIEVANT